MAGVTVVDDISAVDAELSLYLDSAAQFIDDTLKGVASVPLDPVPQIIDTIAEFYASGLFLAKNSLAENQTEHPQRCISGEKLAEFKASFRRSFKLLISK